MAAPKRFYSRVHECYRCGEWQATQALLRMGRKSDEMYECRSMKKCNARYEAGQRPSP